MLRWADYGGGLRGALISAADEVVDGADGDIDTAFRDVMRELVGVGEDGAATRRYASLTRFAAGSAARALLDRLVARRLCVTTDEGLGDGPVTSLAHEALIRSWPRAQQWLQRETALLRIRDELARDAAVWEYHKRVEGWLGVAPEKLAAIRQIEEAGLNAGGRSFRIRPAISAPRPAQSLREARRFVGDLLAHGRGGYCRMACAQATRRRANGGRDFGSHHAIHGRIIPVGGSQREPRQCGYGQRGAGQRG